MLRRRLIMLRGRLIAILNIVHPVTPRAHALPSKPVLVAIAMHSSL